MNEATVGFRYQCIGVLSALAFKSGVHFSQLKEDAMSLIKPFNELDNAQGNPFLESDVKSALKMYHENYLTISIKSIEMKTKIEIKRNKRNGLSRTEHLKGARLKQEQNFRNGRN